MKTGSAGPTGARDAGDQKTVKRGLPTTICRGSSHRDVQNLSTHTTFSRCFFSKNSSCFFFPIKFRYISGVVSVETLTSDSIPRFHFVSFHMHPGVGRCRLDLSLQLCHRPQFETAWLHQWSNHLSITRIAHTVAPRSQTMVLNTVLWWHLVNIVCWCYIGLNYGTRPLLDATLPTVPLAWLPHPSQTCSWVSHSFVQPFLNLLEQTCMRKCVMVFSACNDSNFWCVSWFFVSDRLLCRRLVAQEESNKRHQCLSRQGSPFLEVSTSRLR